MTQAIESLFASLCDKHDLTSINVSFTRHPTLSAEYLWHSYAHWADNNSCASAHGASPQEAVANALKEAAAKRNPDIAVEGGFILNWNATARELAA